MISTFKSFSKGIQRAIITFGIVGSIIATAIVMERYYSTGDVIIQFFIFIILYTILTFVGLWIYDGFENNDKSKDKGKFQSKNEIIRDLIKNRVRQNPELNMDESKINSLQDMRLAGMPESTIVAIVELYAKLKEANISDEDIFQQFEQMRSGSGNMPSPLTLNSYINYRLRLEHEDGIGLTKEFTSDAINICSDHYNL